MDLRERVAAVIDEGEGSQRQVAKRFRVSVSFVTRLLQGRRDVGTLAPKPPSPQAPPKPPSPQAPKPPSPTAAGHGRSSVSPNRYDWRCWSPSIPMPPGIN